MPQSDGDYQCSQRVFSCVSISIPGRDSHRDRVRNIKLLTNILTGLRLLLSMRGNKVF